MITRIYNSIRRFVKNERADIGMGTLIIFIAFLIVSAMAAAVLINAVNLFRQQAERSSEQILYMVSGTFAIKNVAGDRLLPGADELMSLMGEHVVDRDLLATEEILITDTPPNNDPATASYGFYLKAKVNDALTNDPLKSAIVYVYEFSSDKLINVETTTTNDTGEGIIYVNVTELNITSIKIFAEANGYYVPQELEITNSTFETPQGYNNITVDIKLIQIGISELIIDVKDLRSQLAISGATVRILWAGGQKVAITDVSGRVSFDVPTAYIKIDVFAKDYQTHLSRPVLVGLDQNGNHTVERVYVVIYMMPIDFYSDRLEFLMIKLSLMGGVDRVDLGETVIEITDGQTEVSLTMNLSQDMTNYYTTKNSADAEHFSAYPILDVGGVFSPEYPIVTSGDIVLIFINASAIGLDMKPGTNVFIKIIPPNGYPLIEEFTVPPFFGDRYVNLV
ncbi:MAG TPA: hypothetical protein ENK81_00075 [Euryarchaeota archaeon]|nr:hypothetical protein [Euryarchaeota archaeon]